MKKRFLIYQVVVPVLLLFLTTECKKEEPAKLAVLSTVPVTNFTTITAASGGNIASIGGAEISANGVCWSTTANPVTTDSKTVDAGWHVPNNAEWTTLTTLLGGDAVAGDKLRESGTTHWGVNNTGATNETGFTALPGGYIGDEGIWWSSTADSGESVSFWETSTSSYFKRTDGGGYATGSGSLNFSNMGLAVRCLKDD